MKKTVFPILVISSLVLANCGPTTAPANEASGVDAAQPSAQKVEVIWYVRSSENEQKWENEVAIPDFESKHPNIKINLVVVPWADFDIKMPAMTAAGTPPDIWSHWGPSGFQDYVKRGLVADLTPFIEKDQFDLSDFVPEALDIYKVDGKIMGLPILTGGSFIFYNKDLFDAAGVKYPPTNWDDTSWTWDAFLEKAKILTKDTDDPTTAVFGCRLDLWPNDAYAWLWGQDLYPDDAYKTGFADKAFLDSEAAVKAFQAWQDMVWKFHYALDPAQVDAMGGGDLFESGNVAMNLTGGWGWWLYGRRKLHGEFKLGVAALPYGAPGRRDVVFTDPWMLSSKTSHPNEAWTFLKYLASPEVQKGWMDLTGAPPVRKSLAESWYKSFPSMTPEEVKEVHLGALKHGRESPNHLLVKFDQLNQIVQSAVDPIVNNEKKAADTLPEANKKLEEALKQIAAEYKK
jgi:multiple sugar transport system substrate-binding protein